MKVPGEKYSSTLPVLFIHVWSGYAVLKSLLLFNFSLPSWPSFNTHIKGGWQIPSTTQQ